MSNQLPSVTSPPWSATAKRVVGLVVVVLVFIFAREVDGAVWTSMIIALVLSYLLSPVVTFFEHRLSWIEAVSLRRSFSVLLSWFAVVGLFALTFALIVPATIKQLRELAEDLPDLIADTEADLKNVLGKPITIGNYTVVPWDELERAFAERTEDPNASSSLTVTLQDAVLSLADSALGLVGGALSFVITLFFSLTMLFYLMRDGPRFAEYLISSVPESYQGDARVVLYELGLIWNAYLRGQLVLCFVVGFATYIAALILGLPQPLLLALVAGFLEFIPNLGPALAQIPALLFALTTNSTTLPGLEAGLPFAVVVSLTYMSIQQFEAMFLVPRILGHSLDLHPFVVLLAILIGASLVGVIGVVLAAPAAATMRLLGRYLRGKLLDEDMFMTAPALGAQQRGTAYRLIHFFLSRRFPPEELEPSRLITAELARGESADPSDASGWAL